MVEASIVVGDPNDVTVGKLETVIADTDSSIVDGVQRAKIVTPLDPARARDDVRNPQHTPSKRQRTRRPHNMEKHGAPRANRQGRRRQTRRHHHLDLAPTPLATPGHGYDHTNSDHARLCTFAQTSKAAKPKTTYLG